MTNRVAKAADQNSEEQTIPATIATVARFEYDGTPLTLEVDGVLYERPFDQASARKTLESRRLWDKIRAYGVPHNLLNQLDIEIGGSLVDEQISLMRRIGHLLAYHGQHDLWRIIYLEYNRENSYHLGDETLFLQGEPTSGQTGYKGPPTVRYNSALEQAAQLARHGQARD